MSCTLCSFPIILITLSGTTLLSCSGAGGSGPHADTDPNGWSRQVSYTKTIPPFTFHVPAEGLAFAERDPLVAACTGAIERNCKMLEVDSFTVPYRIRFYPSKAAMKAAVNIGVSGHADYWNKELGLVVTDDPAVMEAENIIAPPIAHETMHMVAMEKWGFPPEDMQWLNEGLATAAANNCNGYDVHQVYSHLLSHDRALPMDSLVHGFYACDEMVAYHQAGSYAHYLLQHHGVQKLGALWQEGFASFERIYGISFAAMRERMDAEVLAMHPHVPLDWERFKAGCK